MWSVPRTWVTGELVTSSLLNTHLRDNMNGVLPVGTIILRAANYATVETAVESRWLQCNGVAVNRTTYATLFAYLNGLTPALPFGVGNGTTTFDLPDLRGRAAWSEGEHTSVDVMGDSDGSAIANRGPHHNHNFQLYETSTGSALPNDNILSSNGVASTTLFVGATDGPLNQPAYLVVGSYFIKFTA